MYKLQIGKKIDFFLNHALPYHIKDKLQSQSLKDKLKKLNLEWNNDIYSGEKASLYEINHGFKTDYSSFMQSKILLDIFSEKKYKDVLEVGAGTGYYTSIYAPYVDTLIANELVVDFQKIFSENTKKFDNIELISEDIHEYISCKKFDCILFLSSLHHIPERDKLFIKLEKLLKSDGKIIIIEPHHNIIRVLDVFKKCYYRFLPKGDHKKIYRWVGHDFVSYGEVKSHLKKTNLRVIKYNTYDNLILTRIFNLKYSKKFKIEKLLGKIPFIKYFQQEIYIEISRRN